MRKKIRSLLIVLTILILSACQSLTATALPSQPAIETTATSQLATETPKATPTFISATKESLAGLIISSPILGTPQEHPGWQPTEMITPNGLGIINSEGELIKFSGAGLFESFSPSGVQIVYQHGFEDEYTDRIDNLYVYNSITGETVEIFDSLENEGGKTVISWLQDEQKFIYYNDYETVLFEAFGYFGARQLLLADVTTGQATLLINDGYQFDVSPDQTQIAYTTGEILDSKTDTGGSHRFGCFQPRIYNIALSSSQTFDVSQLKEKPVCLGHPKWSPDGRQIAWMGYFEDDTFHPVIFNLQDETGTIYKALNQKPKGSNLPNNWYFGEPYFGGSFEPDWIDNYTFWTPSYEVNIETGETSTPRAIDLPYNPGRNEYLESPDGSFNVSLNEERDLILLSNMNENFLGSFLLDDLYHGPKLEILTSKYGLFMPGRTNIAGWSPFAPPPNIGNN